MFICILVTKYRFMYFVFVFYNFKMYSLSINNTSHSGWSVICYGRPAASSARLTSGQSAYGCAANQTWIRHSRRPKSESVSNCQWRIVLNWITIWSIQKVLRIRRHYKVKQQWSDVRNISSMSMDSSVDTRFLRSQIHDYLMRPRKMFWGEWKHTYKWAEP